MPGRKFPFLKKSKNQQHQYAVIIGAGEVGFHVAARLAEESRQVTVVDTNPEALRRLTDSLDVQTLQGSGCSPSVLQQAQIGRANLVLAVTDSDEDNLLACFFAAQLAPDAVKIARLRNEDYTSFFERHPNEQLKLNMLINPAVAMVEAVSRLIAFPGAVEYSEFADRRLKLIGVRMIEGPLLGRPLTNFSVIMDEPDVRVAALVRGTDLIIPSGSDVLQAGDVAYFACTESAVPAVRRTTNPSLSLTRNIFIIGGGEMGMNLALKLETQGYHVKLLEKNLERCRFLSERLSSSVVLHGDGTRQDVLREENASAMDVVVAMTGSEETNVLICLLARSLSAEKESSGGNGKHGGLRTITRINNSAYLPLARALGIDHCISPRLSTINSILKFVRADHVLSVIPIREDEAEAFEIVVPENSPITLSPLSGAGLPKDAAILALLRGNELAIPKGDTLIRPGDRLTVFARAGSLKNLMKCLTPPDM